jgi:Fe-S-cluster containining protein
MYGQTVITARRSSRKVLSQMKQPEQWQVLFSELILQRQCLDMMSAAWVADYRINGGTVYCSNGCHSCCSLTVNCTLSEAVSLAGNLDESKALAVTAYARKVRDLTTDVTELKVYLRMQRDEMGMCPLLDKDGFCAVYAERPLSCRSLLSTKESRWCDVDFARLSSEAKQQYIESLDRSVVAFPMHYIASTQETGREFEVRQLTVMNKVFGYSCYGNMPVLVHLVREHGLVEAATRSQAEQIVREAGFANPLLVSWEL